MEIAVLLAERRRVRQLDLHLARRDARQRQGEKRAGGQRHQRSMPVAHLAAQLLERDYTVISIARHAPEMSHPNLHSVEADLLDDAAVVSHLTNLQVEVEITP